MTDDATPSTGQGGLDAPGENMRAVMVGGCVVGYQRGVDKPAARHKVGLGTLRLAAIQRLIEGRHGGPCDTDDGELYLDAAAPLIVASARRRGVAPDLAGWAKRWTPKLYDDHGPEWFDDRLDDVDPDDGRGVTADEFARALGITAAEVKAFGLKTVGAVDRPKRQRTIDRKVTKRDCERARREKAGATPRHRSLTATRPWEAFGISESTWKRRGRPVSPDRNSCPPNEGHMVSTKSGHGSLTPEKTAPKPWVVEGVSRATWFRRRAAATVSVVVPDLAPVVDGDDAPAHRTPAVVLERGRVRFDADQLAVWEEEFPGVDVVAVVAANANSLDDGTEHGITWQDQAWGYLSWEHFKMTTATTPANEDEKISAEAI